MTHSKHSLEEQADDSLRQPYVAPTVRRLGTIRELTKNRSPVGAKDGGANNTRTG